MVQFVIEDYPILRNWTWSNFLSSVATDAGKDEDGLKLEKDWANFFKF